MNHLKGLGVGVLCGVGALATLVPAQRASAVLELTLQGGTPIVDNGPQDTDPTVGRIINSSNVSGFGVSISVAASNSPGAPDGGLLQISSLSIQSNRTAGPATLTVGLSDTDYSLPGGPGSILGVTSSAGGTFAFSSPTDSVTFQSFADPTNAQPVSGGATSSLPLTFTAATPSFSGSDVTAFVHGAGSYSLQSQAVITLSPGAQLNLSGSTQTFVPEPASLGLLAMGGLGLLARRRRNGTAAK